MRFPGGFTLWRGTMAMEERQRHLFFWAHALLVFSAGAIVGWFVQSLKIQLGIDSGWDVRLFLLVMMFGFLAHSSWFLVAGAWSAVSKRELSSFLQADAYSYLALCPLISYQHFQGALGLRVFIACVFLYSLLLKVIFLILANFGKMPSKLILQYTPALPLRNDVSTLCLRYALLLSPCLRRRRD